MKKILTLFILVFSLTAAALAEQQTTVLKATAKFGEATGVMPYIDGSAQEDYERFANGVIQSTLKQMVKEVGNRGSFSYAVQLNRPSLVSVLLQAKNEGNVCYRGLNLDLTKGNDVSIHEFFVADDNAKKLLGKYHSYLLTEKGVYLQDDARGQFQRFVSFAEILPSVRIGAAGRIFQIARLTRKSENKVLKIGKHSLLAIQLDANPSTGYHWEAVLPESGQIIKVASSFILPPQEKERVGVPGKEILFYYTTAEGVFDVEFLYRRGWENFNVDKFKMTIAVRDI